MVTTVTSTERVKRARVGPGGTPPPGKNGPRGNGSGGNGGKRKDDEARRFSPKPYRVTLWIVIAAIFMMFAALIAAYVMLSSGEKWPPIVMPRLLWLSTGLILISSLTFEAARRSLKQGSDSRYNFWLLLTLGFGFGFIASQLFAWRNLVAQRIYLATNNHSSFFYLLTGVHALHLLGGILALGYLLLRTRKRQRDENAEMKRQTSAAVVSVYWHFMDGLWVFLFLLLLFWK
jgi:cytochrome c oxidase subunit 3